ncbi:uncharacterized protein LOC143301002 isoform X3 [Babylonia areolata]|uniref:uncharacterized protein LOC143301002 isoform X3 n=1 Tax=Babylonia areolata TaxID=304850 RepID=UPI003FCFFEA9
MSQSSRLPVSKNRSPPMSLEVSGGNSGSKVKDRRKVKAKAADGGGASGSRNKLFSKKKATPKRTQREDGAGSKSPSDKSQDPSPSTPSPQQEWGGEGGGGGSPQSQPDEDVHQQQQQQQQQEVVLDQSPSSPSESDDAPQSSSPLHQPRPQPQPQPQAQPEPELPHPQPSPQPQRHEAVVVAATSSLLSSSPPPPQASQPPPHADDLSSSDPSSDREESLYSGHLHRKARQGRAAPVRTSESDGEATSPDDGAGGGRRVGPRRHTVGGAQIRDQMEQREVDNERKREAFYELLATRYPQYADKITGMATHHPTTAAERNPRPREPQRRRTTVVTYNPQSSRLLDSDDAGTMSDVEPSTFQRGGMARASLPIVRSASSSLERPIGLVFLVFGEETKKSLLPNEITSLDTVRALFVRAFPEKLSMEFLDSPKRKIYILEAATNIFFQLEDLRDIQDRTVLKIHECDSEEPQRVKSLPESRGRLQQVPVSSRPSSRQGYAPDAAAAALYREEMAKVQSLPVGQNYQEMMHKERAQWEMEQEYIQQRRSRSRSQTPELAERPRSLSTGAPRNRYSHSPERMSTPERAPQPLNPIPENPRLLANGFRQAALNGSHYEVLPGSRSHQSHPGGHPQGHPHLAHPGRVLSPPPPVGQPIYESVYQTAGGYHHPQSYISHSMRTAQPQGPQRATGPPPPDMRGGGRNDPASRHSLAFAAMSNPIYESFPQRSQSYRATHERDVMPPRPQSTTPHDMNRMERMEAQIASLAAWVHHVHASPTESARRGPGSSRKDEGDGSISSSHGLSDIPASYSLRQPVVTVEMREKMNDMHFRLKELRVELQGLKRMEQLHQEAMRDAISDTLFKIKKAMSGSGKAEDIYGELRQLTRHSSAEAYLRDKTRVEQDLRGLETRVDGLKEDVLTRRCPVNVSNIEGQAVQLGHVTKSLADLKSRCPKIHEALKDRSESEGQDFNNEQFLRDEPAYIEAALKRCRTLTSSLVTLKRIASSQDTSSSPAPPVAVETKAGDEEDTMAILEHLRALVPDYDFKVHTTEPAASHRSMPQTSIRSEMEPRQTTVTAERVDSVRCEPPQVPAKPARLLSASEIKQMGAATGSGSVLSASSSSAHTVTVTSQITDHNDNAIPADRTSARSAFFSSMQSPPTSPVSSSDSGKSSSKPPTTTKAVSSGPSSLSPSVSSSASSLTSPAHSKAVPGVYYQAVSPTRTRSAFSSIPLPNRPDKDDSSKGKKVPPPPPPRTSSAKLYGVSPNGGVAGRRDSGDKSPDARKKDSSLSVYQASSPTSPGASGPKGQRAMNKFQKDIAAGIYANLNRPDLQHQKMVPDRLISNMPQPPPAAVVTNSQDPQEEGELSGSESTGSSTSLDSQQGMVTLMRANSSAAASARGPKPNPPQRHSSLSSRSSISEEPASKTKTQMLQERVKKSQESGSRRGSSGGGASSSSSQVNGVDSTGNGHKT